MQERAYPQEAVASTPRTHPNPAQRALQREEELLRRFQEASVAYYLLAEADRPERLEKVGRLMDRLAEELRS